MARRSEIKRKTNETEVSLIFSPDGRGVSNIATGIGFMDHMLTLFARHGMFDLVINAAGDLEVDAHHTVEDIGIVLGQALKEALGDKKSISRYGTSFVPMDEALAMVSLDISGRPFLAYDASFSGSRIGEMDTELFEEFFRAFAFNAGITLHIKVMYGTNNHHVIEAVFKALGRALSDAVKLDGRIEGVLSTKGTL